MVTLKNDFGERIIALQTKIHIVQSNGTLLLKVIVNMTREGK